MNNENELTEKDLDEVIDELEKETAEEYSEEDRRTFVKENEQCMVIKTPKPKSKSFWKNLKYMWYYPYKKTPMQKHFQKLARITPRCVARLTLPDKTEVEFTELPKWYDVIRYQISGFKFEVFHIDEYD